VELIPDLLKVLGALAAGAAMAALSLAAWEMYLAFSRRYRATLSGESAALASGGPLAGTLAMLRRTLIAFLAAVNERFVPKRYLDRLQSSLRRAGHPGELAPAELVALMEVAAFFFLMLGMLVSIWLELSPFAWPVAAAFGGLYPLIWLRDRIKARQHAITRALPYNLDLLTLSVEAGLDFAAAIGKVVEKGRKGPLCEELGLTLRELKLGKTREEALRNLAARVELSSITTFVNALVQADRMGTPLGKILRILSTQMRIERTQRAEKLANEAPVKLLAPLIGCIFPTIFIMLFGPIAFRVFFGGD
jgi:tight adherence protein C